MSQTFDFGELRSLLQRAPSAHVWEAVCALVDHPAWDEAAEQWLPYAEELLGRSWPDALRVWPDMWWFRLRQPRGVALVRAFAPSNMTTRQMERLGETIPAHGVRLRDVRLRLDTHTPEALAGLARALRPWVRALELEASLGNAPMLRALLEEPCPELERLRVRSGLEDEALVSAVFDGVAAPRLTALSMDYNRVEPWMLWRPLRYTPLAGQLRELSLDGVPVRDTGAMAISSQPWEALERLSLNNVGMSAAGLSLVLRRTPALRALYVQENPLGADPKAWFELEPAIRLHELDVRRTAHGPDAPVTWVDAPWIAPSAAQVAALLELEQVSELRALSLREAQLEAETVRTLIARFAGQLERLDLSYVRCPTLWEQLRGTRWPKLRALSAHCANPPDLASEALASMDMPALTSLDLQFMALTSYGAALLERAPWRDQLVGFYPPVPKG